MHMCEGFYPSQFFVDLGIVFHGAGAERHHGSVYGTISLGELCVMPYQVKLRDPRKVQVLSVVFTKVLDYIHRGHIQLG